jgi:hypothetical protein
MPIFTSYLCAALGHDSSLVPIHGTNDYFVQHGSNSFGGQPEDESAWIEIKRKPKKTKKPNQNSRSMHARSHHNSDQVKPNANLHRTIKPVVPLFKRSKSAISKTKAAKKSIVTLTQANDILDIIIRTAVTDSIKSLQIVGALPSKKALLTKDKQSRVKNEVRAFKKASTYCKPTAVKPHTAYKLHFDKKDVTNVTEMKFGHTIAEIIRELKKTQKVKIAQFMCRKIMSDSVGINAYKTPISSIHKNKRVYNTKRNYLHEHSCYLVSNSDNEEQNVAVDEIGDTTIPPITRRITRSTAQLQQPITINVRNIL